MKYLSYIILLFVSSSSFGQWQWGQRGGSTDQMESTHETVSSIVTDSQGNIYILSAVGKNNLDIAGNPKQNFGDTTTLVDYAVASFTCDGVYRWSKIVGGSGKETIKKLLIDSNDNIYISGTFNNCGGNNNPSRIDNDIILDDNTFISCRLAFFAKYNSDGEMQWIKFPQGYADIAVQTLISDNAIDADNNLYILAKMTEGTYADGAFVNNLPGRHTFILKYDTLGNYLGHMYIDLIYTIEMDLTMYRNPNNGHFYFTGDRYSTDNSATIGGESIGPGFFMASFDQNGQFLWKRQSTAPAPGYISPYGLTFDESNNIYFSGRIAGFNTVSFQGYSVAEALTPPFIMKLNPTAENIVWVSNANKSNSGGGGFTMKGDELAVTTLIGQTYTWAGQTIVVGAQMDGGRTGLARFNRNTGNCTTISFIPSLVGDSNMGTAITTDPSGDYIVGGRFSGTQNFLTNSNTNVGGFSDFFVAKYAANVCSMGIEDKLSNEVKAYPNSVNDILTVENINGNASYTLYSVLGVKILEGTLTEKKSQINMSHFGSGSYVLKIVDGLKIVNVKILKK